MSKKRYICQFCYRVCIGKAGYKNHLLKTHLNEFLTRAELEKEYFKKILNISNDITDNIVLDYLAGNSISDISSTLNCHREMVENFLKSQNIPMRTLRESKQTSQYKEKYLKTILEKYGVNNISKSELIKEKKVATFIKNHGVKHVFCIKEVRDKAFLNINYVEINKKAQQTIREKYGVNNIIYIDGVKERIRKKAYERLSKLNKDELRKLTEKARMAISHKSSIQLRVRKALENLNVPYVEDCFLFSYGFDFLVNDNILIEVQGDFWHANPKQFNEEDLILGNLSAKKVWDKDRRKREKVILNGYKVFYLWESDINTMTDKHIESWVLNIIKEKKTC